MIEYVRSIEMEWEARIVIIMKLSPALKGLRISLKLFYWKKIFRSHFVQGHWRPNKKPRTNNRRHPSKEPHSWAKTAASSFFLCLFSAKKYCLIHCAIFYTFLCMDHHFWISSYAYIVCTYIVHATTMMLYALREFSIISSIRRISNVRASLSCGQKQPIL